MLKKGCFKKDNQMMILKCYVTTGLSEGKYYVEKYKDKIKEALGFYPFFGTLNLNFGDHEKVKEVVKKAKKIYISGFNEFKEVNFIKCQILKDNQSYDVWMTIPEIRKHNSIEIIADVNLREKFKLNDNDVIYLKFDI